MALINLPGGYWIDIPAEGYGIDYGKNRIVLERKISPDRVVELLREHDADEPFTYSCEEAENA